MTHNIRWSIDSNDKSAKNGIKCMTTTILKCYSKRK